MDDNVFLDRAKFAVEFGAMGCGGHMVNWDRVPIILLGSIEYLAIPLPWFDEDVLRHDEAMWNEVPDPMRYAEGHNCCVLLCSWWS